MWHATWSREYVKATQDVEFYNQGKDQLGKTNITRDIAFQPYFYLTQALNCLRWQFQNTYCINFHEKKRIGCFEGLSQFKWTDLGGKDVISGKGRLEPFLSPPTQGERTEFRTEKVKQLLL